MQFNILTTLESIELNYDSIHEYFKSNYNNKINTKQINDNLVLVYNSFIANNVLDKKLFNECRSIVLDINPSASNRIISYTHDNIIYFKINEYINPEANDVYKESFEGTLVSVFNHDGKWFFATSRCPDIDKSYFYNKTKTFGSLFDDCLKSDFLQSNIELDNSIREQLVSYLDTNNCYYFVIIHHENKHIIDYSDRFGLEYKKLIHVFTRKQSTQELIDVKIPFIEQPKKFDNYEAGINFINDTNVKSEGLIVEKFDQTSKKTFLIKIMPDPYWIEKAQTPNYPNRWFVYLDIYRRDDPNFRITDYQLKNNIVENLEFNTKPIDITGMIYLLYKGTSQCMYNLVMHFTDFNFETKTYIKINKSDYELISNSKHGVLRKQITVLQNLINKQTIKSSTNIITHLRKYVRVEDMVGLLGSMSLLMSETKLINYSNNYYQNFVNIYLEQLRQ